MNSDVRAHVMALVPAGSREAAAGALARYVGAQELALFVLDPAAGVLVPAVGMPKTYPGGPRWRAFLHSCRVDGDHAADVDLPTGTLRPALAWVHEGAAAILLGGSTDTACLAELRGYWPLLGALLRSEREWAIGQAEIRESRLAADRAQALVKALDASRASAASLNEQLRREQSRKDEFLAMLAHELRNPLAPLLSSLTILKRTERVEPLVMTRQLDIMSRQVTQLTRLVDDLLDLSRVSRGLIDLRREPLRLAEVLHAAAEAARPAIDARHHQLQFFGDFDGLYVNGDRVRLTQVFTNLLQNAAKYTDPGGALSIGVITDLGRASVLVRDNGIGIPRDMQSRIFDLFEQVPVSLDRSQGGLGIGLTLVRTLAELHGGRVTAYSQGLNQGSTFTVTLPLVKAPERRAPTPGPVPAPQAQASARVLVVDDNVDAGDSLTEMLRLMGADARVARDGPQALRLAESFAPDLVLLDIGLPGMDGYETARHLRELPGLHMRLVALTGYGSSNDRERSKSAGFDAHLVKPAAVDAIESLLAACSVSATSKESAGALSRRP